MNEKAESDDVEKSQKETFDVILERVEYRAVDSDSNWQCRERRFDSDSVHGLLLKPSSEL